VASQAASAACGVTWTAQALLSEMSAAPNLQACKRLDTASLTMREDAELHPDWTVAAMATLCHFDLQTA